MAGTKNLEGSLWLSGRLGMNLTNLNAAPSYYPVFSDAGYIYMRNTAQMKSDLKIDPSFTMLSYSITGTGKVGTISNFANHRETFFYARNNGGGWVMTSPVSHNMTSYLGNESARLVLSSDADFLSLYFVANSSNSSSYDVYVRDKKDAEYSLKVFYR